MKHRITLILLLILPDTPWASIDFVPETYAAWTPGMAGADDWLQRVDANLVNVGPRIPMIAAVALVPAPSAVWLFGTALIGLVGFSKRKSKVAFFMSVSVVPFSAPHHARFSVSFGGNYRQKKPTWERRVNRSL